ncbi:molecular chaperone DnaJ [Novosphingobium sp.]|uniref:molecular chaperone DnaJ n=1 Tax=Novosphingobium sp. TaxID=1874826 RepID=UPI00286B9B8F|nr:molecular chaperone DnaJ [Novosphingobium sp.]
MGKLITLALLGSLACRLLTGHWPWQFWQKSERSQKEAQARALLGVAQAATRAEIADATRRLIVRVHPDRGGSNQAVHAATAARDVLIARLDRIEADAK